MRRLYDDFRLLPGFVRLLLSNGKRDCNGGSLFPYARNADVAIISANVSGADAETKARPLADFGGEKRLKDVWRRYRMGYRSRYRSLESRRSLTRKSCVLKS